MPNEKKTKGIIERIEGSKAVIETQERELINVPFSALPEGFRIGSRVEIDIKVYRPLKKPFIDDLFA